MRLPWWLSASTGGAFTTTHWTRWSSTANWRDIVVGDFNGDGIDDIAGRDGRTWRTAWFDGSSVRNVFWTRWGSESGWEHVSVGDFNGDGRDDIAAFRNGNWWLSSSASGRVRNLFWTTWSPGTWEQVIAADFA